MTLGFNWNGEVLDLWEKNYFQKIRISQEKLDGNHSVISHLFHKLGAFQILVKQTQMSLCMCVSWHLYEHFRYWMSELSHEALHIDTHTLTLAHNYNHTDIQMMWNIHINMDIGATCAHSHAQHELHPLDKVELLIFPLEIELNWVYTRNVLRLWYNMVWYGMVW